MWPKTTPGAPRVEPLWTGRYLSGDYLHEFRCLGAVGVLVLNLALHRQKGVKLLWCLQHEREGEWGVGGSGVAILDFLGQTRFYLLPLIVQFLHLGEEAGSV